MSSTDQPGFGARMVKAFVNLSLVAGIGVPLAYGVIQAIQNAKDQPLTEPAGEIQFDPTLVPPNCILVENQLGESTSDVYQRLKRNVGDIYDYSVTLENGVVRSIPPEDPSVLPGTLKWNEMMCANSASKEVK